MPPRRFVGEEELDALREVIESQEMWRGTNGGVVGQFEDAFAEHIGRRYVHAVSAGTAANEAALAAVGVGPGDEVIVPPCSMIATSMSVVALGGVPVFADVDPRTMILDPQQIEQHITDATKAVVVVHLFGQPAEMDDIAEVARKHGLALVEDCAQAYDAFYKGTVVGALGDAASWSMQQSKHLTSGEGGIIATDDPEAYKRAVLYANCGMPWYRYGLEGESSEPIGDVLRRGHFALGHNYRLTNLQGAVALCQLKKMDENNAHRRKIVEALDEELRGAEGVLLPHVYPDTQPNYWAYPMRLDPATISLTASEVAGRCREEHGVGIGCYSEINYLEDVFQRMNAERRTSVGVPLPDYVRYDVGACPAAEAAAPRLLVTSAYHGQDPEDSRKLARALRATVEAIAEGP